MFPILASVLASVLYCLSAFLIFKQLGDQAQHRRKPLAIALMAMLLHVYLLNHQIYRPSGLNLEFFVAFSLISWLISVQILLSCIFRRIESLGIAVFPMSGLAVLLVLLDFTDPLIISATNALQGHIMISVIAYSLIMLGAIQASLIAYQDHAIRSHHPGGMIRFLPPLHDMETLLFQFLSFGFVGLSASLVTGFIFLEDIFAQHLVHKTVLSIIAWFILGILLIGRFKFGWRGKTAIRWSLSAFALLMLAYFGSKLVLEFIL
jgi:ABC-type uncharacterized transport system permease subunit